MHCKSPVACLQCITFAPCRAVAQALQLPPESAELDALIPAKAGDLELAKLPAPSRVVIYLLDKVPILIDTSGKNDVLPTVLGLWRAPDILPQIFLKHPAVSQYLLNGADLMLPGVDIPQMGLPPFEKGSLVCICVRGNPAPLAIGYAAINSTTAGTYSQGKGKLVEVVQVFGDHLWQDLGSREIPNEGYHSNVVLSLDEHPNNSNNGGCVSHTSEGVSSNKGAIGMYGAAEHIPDTWAAAAAAGIQEGLDRLTVDDEEAAAEAAVASTSAPVSPSPAGAHDISTESHAYANGPSASTHSLEQLLEMALLQALHKCIKDADLPLTGSAVWAQHMVPNRPPGSTLDVKQSKHKKLSKMLQVGPPANKHQ